MVLVPRGGGTFVPEPGLHELRHVGWEVRRMLTGHGVIGSALFGASELVEVDRALAEIRAGRPVRVRAGAENIIALPIEGLTPARLAAFRTLCGPEGLRLVLTARRARAVGLQAVRPLALDVPDNVSVESLMALAIDAKAAAPGECKPAGPAADAMIDLIKQAEQIPAVLVADSCHAVADSCHAVFHEGDSPIATVAAEAVKNFRGAVIDSLVIASDARVPIAAGGTTRFVVFRDLTGRNSVAVVIGKPDLSAPVAVRLHSACLTGDVFGSRRCDCGDQLRLGIDHLNAAGGGIVLYLPQEGRGLGLANKMRAYRLQDAGLDTIDANTTLGFNDDERDYGIAAGMLKILGIGSVLLLTNNPAKVEGLAREGITIVRRMPLQAPVNPDNRRYLAAKASRAGHQLDDLITALSVSPKLDGDAVLDSSSAVRGAAVKTQA